MSSSSLFELELAAPLPVEKKKSNDSTIIEDGHGGDHEH